MRKLMPFLPFLLCSSLLTSSPILAIDSDTTSPNKPISPPITSPTPNRQNQEPFTGRITKNKVRVRLQPSFDAHVLRELNRDDLIVVKGESNDFYAIQPPKGIKAYIFRTFVLDNTIEGSHVNVRLKPDLEAPVVAQLNSGDHVTGTVNTANNKWLEIDLPDPVLFYISKDYVEKIGDAGLMARLDKRREEARELLNTTHAAAAAELQKSFDQIQLDPIVYNYQQLIAEHQDFPEFSNNAKQALQQLQEAYTNKKIAYLESQTTQSSHVMENQTHQLNHELQAHKARIAYLEQKIQKEQPAPFNDVPSPKTLSDYPVNMSAWFPTEEALFAVWSKQAGSSSMENFYREQMEKGFTVKGVVEPYNRPVKNKPGDYMIVSSSNQLPIAFLYSTRINLQDYVGREVSVLVSPRSNNHYAFPAYFVLSIE